MPTAQSILLSVFGIFLLQLLARLRRVAHNVSNLSGPFYLFSPLSTVGFMVARMMRQIPYINVGRTWALKRKHEDFIMAGQDAFAMISAFPVPKSMIYIADAAAIKEITAYRHLHQIAQFVIGVAGFGRRVTWTSDLVVPLGHQMTFKDALHILSTNLIQKIIAPDWAKNLTKHSRNIELAFTELKQYMLEMVEARRNVDKVEDRHDLFSGLLDAAQDEPGDGAGLSDEELIGNMFVFLFAGHETTAHTLCFTFALLALYPDEQERLYQHIKGVMSNLNGMPTYEDMGRFTQSLAVFYETLRLFPPVPLVPKIATEDTTLTVGNIDGGMTTFPVPSGMQIDIHVPGLHYNPRYWEQPHKFMPERFLGDWPKDAFLPFSQGARACLGRWFFETEGIAALTTLVSRYRIEVKEEPEFSGETFEERYARITAFDQSMTTTPVRVPLVFKRR